MTQVVIETKEQSKDEIVHKIGNWYKHSDSSGPWLLANVNGKGVLVSPFGKDYHASFPVDNIFDITAKEFNIICADESELFTLVPSITIAIG